MFKGIDTEKILEIISNYTDSDNKVVSKTAKIVMYSLMIVFFVTFFTKWVVEKKWKI